METPTGVSRAHPREGEGPSLEDPPPGNPPRPHLLGGATLGTPAGESRGRSLAQIGLGEGLLTKGCFHWQREKPPCPAAIVPSLAAGWSKSSLGGSTLGTPVGESSGRSLARTAPTPGERPGKETNQGVMGSLIMPRGKICCRCKGTTVAALIKCPLGCP